ncbi:MAG TPA: ABC transporter permease [Candidatus Solibacter sp.]|nr:ABC transporter permease [Candidatus Solibacter sp.]
MFERNRDPRDFNAEVEAHLKLEADRLHEEGLTDDEALHAARRAFGNLTQARERFYERGRWLWFDHLRQDVRFALRTLSKNPGFTAIAMITLALGIGANSTVFSWINSTLLDPIPGAARADEIVSVTRGGTVSAAGEFSYPDYVDLRAASHSFAGLIAFNTRPVNLTGTGKPLRVWSTVASANYFDVLGVRPILGRGFLPAEDLKPEGAPVVVLSYPLWQTRYGGDPHVIGRSISINQHPFTIIGVTPPEFQGSLTGLRTDLWVPVMMQREVISSSDRLHDRGSNWLMSQGRLAPGVLPEQAHQELNVLMQHLVEQFPDNHFGHNDVGVYPLWRAPNGANAYFYILLPMLMALAGAVLLLACANVANLLLVRSVARRREIAIRLSLGASRKQVVRQLMVESALLAIGGGVLAMLLAEWSAGTFQSFIPATSFPVSLNLHPDHTVLLATLGIALGTGLVFGLLPALRSSGIAPAAVLKEEGGNASGGRRKARLTGALVVAQLALSIFLLVTAGLFIRGFRKAQGFDPGFNPDHVLVTSYDLYSAGYTWQKGLEFDRQLLAKLDAVPGIQSVTLADAVPLGFVRNTEMVKFEGYAPQPHEAMDVRSATVGPDYLRTMQIPLVEGRDFTFEDTKSSQQVAIVNQALAERYWPNQDALGKRVWAEAHWSTIVGIARNSDYDHLDERPQPFLFIPMLQDYWTAAIIEVRVPGNPMAFASAVERTVHELNADMPLYGVAPLTTYTQVASSRQRIAGTFVGSFGLLALILATVGIYGVVAYSTRQRTHEIGIRVALGATRAHILQLVLGHGLRLTLAGLAAGLLLSLGITRLMRGELFGVAPTDALTYSIVAALLAGVALAACYIPARRAMRADATLALRCE